MKKVLLISALTVLMSGIPSVMANAGNSDENKKTANSRVRVEKREFKYNWFVSAAAGGQVYFGDHDKQASFGTRLSPALDIAVGKWFTPSVGMRLMYSGLNAQGATQSWGSASGGIHSTGKHIDGKYEHDYGFLTKSKMPYFHLHADVMFSACNILKGYKADRLCDFSPYVGIGWGHVYEAPVTNAFIGSLGFLTSFRLGEAFNVFLDVRGNVFGDKFDGEQGHRSGEGIITTSIGFTYKFKNRNWIPRK